MQARNSVAVGDASGGLPLTGNFCSGFIRRVGHAAAGRRGVRVARCGWVSSGQGRCLGGFVSEVVAELASADVDGFFASLA